ncbi:MAG: ATP-binding cassette domain-containing protein [Chitinivibrionales bacterium]|nr:ATP-binding cassette domain-containing protein [Chitinivibrionales bacterium]
MPLLSVTNLSTSFHSRRGTVRVVNSVGFNIDKGETLGIAGESGSGKSVLCYSLTGLVPQPPGTIESGEALFDGCDLLKCTTEKLRSIRGNRIGMIFQDPMTSLNPYLSIGSQLVEPLTIHRGLSKKEASARGIDALTEVGIQDAPRRMRQFPHEFSGGMRQRVMIAMALINNPDLVIADEPTTALDVTVQAQILDLIGALQHKHNSAVILVTHDLGVIAGICKRVMIMYAGRVLESGSAGQVLSRPRHPYTFALQKSMPAFTKRGNELYTIPGAPPDLSREIIGCPFAPRCEFKIDKCVNGPCQLLVHKDGHATACVRINDGDLLLDTKYRAGFTE